MSESPARELQTQVEPELLRGITLDICLSGWARHFVPPDPGMFKVDQSLYDLSKQTEFYDEFLSHDWETSRWYKLCAMLWIYNSQAAFVCTLLMSISVGIFRATEVFPNALWTQLCVFLVFPVVLCFWQRIRGIFCRQKVVFLDKLCIAQHDEELKLKGIFGLAGFLDQSHQLTIFWSYRYFSRLWCTYEVATFLKSKEQKPILLIPVKLAVILCLVSAGGLVEMIGYYMSAYVNLNQERDATEDIGSGQLLRFLIFFSILHMLIHPLAFYIGIGMMVELNELPKQLRHFRVQDAKCFCCSCHHRHPETGEVLPCDRELMFQMLKKWFGKNGDLHEEHLDSFNQLVHEELAPRVLQDLGSDLLSLNYSAYTVIAPSLPGLCTLIPDLVAGPSDSSFDVLQHGIWVLRQIMDYSMIVVLALVLLRLSFLSMLIVARSWSNYSRLCAVLMPAALLLLMSMPWLSFQIALRYSAEDSLLPAIPFALWTILCFCVLASKARNQSGLAAQQSSKEEVPGCNVIGSTFDEGSNSSTFST
eukprot:Skav208073  [mRNA]  locus=scaffold2107:86304:87902:- [translate_table: standard]